MVMVVIKKKTTKGVFDGDGGSGLKKRRQQKGFLMLW